MTPKRSYTLFAAAGLAALAGLALPAPGPAGGRDPGLRIGLMQTMFQELPPALVQAAARPFKSVMAAQTGLEGDMSMLADADTLCRQLSSGEVHLGVFPGFEYAWARMKYPMLKPLVIAVKKAGATHAVLVTRKGSGVGCFGDLKGKAVSVPKAAREHVRLFLCRGCEECGGKAVAALASKVSEPRSSEAAINEVAMGRADAAVADTAALASYKRLYPKQADRIEEAVKSECFPASVVVYNQNALDPETARRIRTGLAEAHKTRAGQDLMFLWKLSSFSEVPDDYEDTLQRIVKAYPPR